MLEKIIPRMQLVELEDLPSFPKWLRRYLQDYLQFMGDLSDKPLGNFVIRLRWAMQAAGETRIVDLCSGSGGPVGSVVRLMQKQERYPVTAKLTDLYPNAEAMALREKESPNLLGVRHPVDATNVPADLAGFRLLCNSFHHFDPTTAGRVLGDAVAKQQGIAVVEMVSRSIPGLIAVLVGVLSQFIFTPFLRPFRFGRIFFTYVIPLVPLTTIWDGCVSCLRVYSTDDMEALVQPYRDTVYRWELGKLPIGKGPGYVHYLIGYPNLRRSS